LTGGNLAGSANVTATTINWNAGLIASTGTISIPVGGTLAISGTSFKELDSGTLSNAGGATWAGTGPLTLSNSALLDNLSGATFDIQTDQPITQLGGGAKIRNAGTWTKTAGSGTTAISPDFTNNGAVTMQSGAMSFGNLTNNGQISLGTSARTLALVGSFTQGATGVLNLKIGGLSAGTQFDQVTIAGSATLGGTLSVSLIGGFTPSTGNSFQVVTYGFARSSTEPAQTGSMIAASLHSFS